MCLARQFTQCDKPLVLAQRHSGIVTDAARRVRAARVLIASFCVVSFAGCDAMQPAGRSDSTGLSPVLVRLKETYPDLANGRFVVLADFEAAEQEKLLRVTDANGDEGDLAQPVIDITVARNETGAGSIRSDLPNPSAILRVDGVRSEQLALIRDWSAYQLLMFCTRASAESQLEIAITGAAPEQVWTSRIRVGPRWQVHRVDLADVAESVRLTDVRGISLHVVDNAGPLTLNLDDVVLADNSREILPYPGIAAGELGVHSAGRRIHVASRDRFDLAFCDGTICAWTSESTQNLTVRSGLGPWPVALPADWQADHDNPPSYDDPAMFSALGEVAAASQRVIEATPYRAQIEGEWRFVRGEMPASQTPPSFRWRYTVYGDGRVYVYVRCDPADAAWRSPFLGQAVALRGDRDFDRLLTPTSLKDPAPPYTLLSRHGRDRADLLWVTGTASDSIHSLFLSASDQRRDVAVIGEREANGTVEFADLLVIWPRDFESSVDAEPIARTYQHPAKLTARTGKIVLDRSGDLNHDGFNEAEGLYEVAALDGIARFDITQSRDGAERPRIRVGNTAGMKAWVYVAGRIVRDVGRDADDNLLFTVPPVGGNPIEIEVNARPETTAPMITRPTTTSQPSE